jgi:hypothetical protein
MALDWARQELTLALELYFASGADVTAKYPDAPSSEARALSHTLKRLSAHPPEQ